MTACLQVLDATRRFGGLVAVDGVSFDVPDTGVTAVIGPNGAGKTTLFNLISGAIQPSSGRIVFGGEDVTALAPPAKARRGLVRTFQLVKLFQDLSVLDNVKVGFHLGTRGGLVSALLRLPATRRMERQVEDEARALLAMVGLAGLEDRPAATLAYGQQRLLEVARALAVSPKLLLLDEPAAGLNGEESARLAEVIRRIASERAVLLIEHDMQLVMNTADDVVVIDFGRKIAQGTPDQVRADPAVIAAYLG